MVQHLSAVESSVSQQAQQKKLLRKLGGKYFIATVIARWVDSDVPITPVHSYAEMIRLADNWIPPQFPVTGDDLIAKGFVPGKALGERFRVLEEAWEASDYRLTREELLARG